MSMATPTMEPPPRAVYPSLEELMQSANDFAKARGYKLVIVRSKTNAVGQKTWVQLACDRHGTKRNTHGLTEETRKKNRRSRRCECPMYCVASKRGQIGGAANGLWELTTRNAEHNHGPYEPPGKKKKDAPAPHSSEIVNLPLLQTPGACIADFCLIPIGSSNPSVSAEIAEVQRLLSRSGLVFSMHSSGTTIEGPWDDVMRIIGQAHSLLHASGLVRIQNDIRIGTRTDKKQSAQDKIEAVQAHLHRQPQSSVHAGPEPDDDQVDDHDDMTDPAIQQMSQAMAPIQHTLPTGLDRVVPSVPSNINHQPPPHMPPPMSHHPHPHHHPHHPHAHHPMTPHMPPHHSMGPPMSLP